MAQGKVEICGVNTAKLPVLKNEEKQELFARIEQGDQEAREAYIKGNLRLVLSVIKRFSQSNENVDDLFQIGCIGLIKAIDNFDSSLDVKFSTYAVPMNVTSRENIRRMIMTRKQAISQAIDILSGDTKNKDIVYVLKQILEELPLSGWTNESIIDSIESYAYEHNNTLPTISELTRENKLPSNTVINSKFGIKSMNVFYKKYFSFLQPQNKSSSPYRFEKDNYFLNIFKDNYMRIKKERKVKSVSTNLYNQFKTKNTPHISTIIKRCNCKTYNDLLILCGYKNSKEKLKSSLSVSYDDKEERISELNNLPKV